MEQLTILTALVAIVIVIVAIQTVQLVGLSQKSPSTGLVIAGQSQVAQAPNQGFSSYEEMMSAHHGGSSGSSGSSLGGLPQQVGGC